MNITTISVIYLWLLVIVSLVSGVSMTTLLIRNKRHKGNFQKNELWLHGIQRFFWIFLGVMALVGLFLGVLTFG